MSGSTINEQLVEPDEKMFMAEIGAAYPSYKAIEKKVGEYKDGVQPKWKFYGKKNGWLLKLMSGKRNVLFVVPQKDHFRVSFTFGESIFENIMNCNVHEKIKSDLFQAKKYAEGRTIQIKVENGANLKDILTLINIKMTTIPSKY